MSDTEIRRGIDVVGDLTNGLTVTVYGRERIRAVRDAALLSLNDPRAVDRVALRRAVEENADQVVLPSVDDEEAADHMAGLLDEVHNGDDPAPGLAATALRTAQRRMVPPAPTVMVPAKSVPADSMAKWEGETDNEKWALIVETDCFSYDEAHVVVLDAEQESERIGSVLLLLTPDQAREVANTLLREATSAELQTERSCQYRQENP